MNQQAMDKQNENYGGSRMNPEISRIDSIRNKFNEQKLLFTSRESLSKVKQRS